MTRAKWLLLAAGMWVINAAHADDRDLWMFAQWAGDHQTRPFREMLVDARLYGVVPIHQLLRSASDWRLCRASPFAVPPASQWPAVRSTLSLLKSLDDQGILRQFEVVGNVSLAFFLAMALMSMKLWELAEVAGPLLVILLAQTVLMFAYGYFVTFRVMGRDYDAAVIAAGHCGFGMGATPNAMANMQAFTAVNGPSVKAFFVIPLVGSLFIDFFNAVIITGFINYLK